METIETNSLNNQGTVITFSIIYVFLLLIGLPSNLYCLCVWKNKTNTSNVFIVNILLCNCLIMVQLLIQIPYQISSYWLLGSVLCEVWSFIVFVGFSCLISFLTSTNLDLCGRIYSWEYICSPVRIWIAVVLIWAVTISEYIVFYHIRHILSYIYANQCFFYNTLELCIGEVMFCSGAILMSIVILLASSSRIKSSAELKKNTRLLQNYQSLLRRNIGLSLIYLIPSLTMSILAFANKYGHLQPSDVLWKLSQVAFLIGPSFSPLLFCKYNPDMTLEVNPKHVQMS